MANLETNMEVTPWTVFLYAFAPGTNFLYSNAGYYLLGVIVEKVPDMAYAVPRAVEIMNAFLTRLITQSR